MIALVQVWVPTLSALAITCQRLDPMAEQRRRRPQQSKHTDATQHQPLPSILSHPKIGGPRRLGGHVRARVGIDFRSPLCSSRGLRRTHVTGSCAEPRREPYLSHGGALSQA